MDNFQMLIDLGYRFATFITGESYTHMDSLYVKFQIITAIEHFSTIIAHMLFAMFMYLIHVTWKIFQPFLTNSALIFLAIMNSLNVPRDVLFSNEGFIASRDVTWKLIQVLLTMYEFHVTFYKSHLFPTYWTNFFNICMYTINMQF